MRLLGVTYTFNLEEEMKSLGIENIRPCGANIQASCPHKDHPDRHRSFGIRLDTGQFNCFACGFHGSFLDLICYLKGYSNIYQALKYLKTKYPSQINSQTAKELPFFANRDKGEKTFLDESVLEPYRLDKLNYFIEERNITFETQQKFELGYDREAKEIVIPWRDYRGRLVLLKRKFVLGKQYKYPSNSEKSHQLFGLNFVYAQKIDEVVLVEGDFDCIYGQQEGLPAVAIGSNLISKEQVQALRKAGIKKVKLLLDNDERGIYGMEQALPKLKGFQLFLGHYNSPKKDINELSKDEVKNIKFERIL